MVKLIRGFLSGFSRSLFLFMITSFILWQAPLSELSQRDFLFSIGVMYGCVAILAVFEALLVLYKVVNRFDRKRMERKERARVVNS